MYPVRLNLDLLACFLVLRFANLLEQTTNLRCANRKHWTVAAFNIPVDARCLDNRNLRDEVTKSFWLLNWGFECNMTNLYAYVLAPFVFLQLIILDLQVRLDCKADDVSWQTLVDHVTEFPDLNHISSDVCRRKVDSHTLFQTTSDHHSLSNLDILSSFIDVFDGDSERLS